MTLGIKVLTYVLDVVARNWEELYNGRIAFESMINSLIQ